MVTRSALSVVLLAFVSTTVSAVKPADPGVMALGIRALQGRIDGDTAVLVTQVSPNSPAQRLFEHQDPGAISKPYVFHELEPGDMITHAGKFPTDAGNPMEEVKDVRDLQLILHQNLGGIITLRVNSLGTAKNPVEFQVKVQNLPVK